MARAPPSGTFDWLFSLSASPELGALLNPLSYGVPATGPVLVVGCGDSTLSEELHAAGVARVCSVDVEPRCVAHMRERTQGKDGLEWEVLDLCQQGALAHRRGLFACAVDKGTLDAIVCAGDMAACRAAWNVVEALEPQGGLFIVATLHADREVERFLDHPELGLRVAARASPAPELFQGKILACRREKALGSFERYAAGVGPGEGAGVSAEEEAALRVQLLAELASLDASAGAGRRLPARCAYWAMFGPELRAEYGYGDFAGDLAAFRAARGESGGDAEEVGLTVDEAVAFLREMS